MKKVEIDWQRCKGCMLCTIYCPKKILFLSNMVNQDGYKVATCVDDDRCIGCMSCAAICPSVCFEIYKDVPIMAAREQ